MNGKWMRETPCPMDWMSSSSVCAGRTSWCGGGGCGCGRFGWIDYYSFPVIHHLNPNANVMNGQHGDKAVKKQLYFSTQHALHVLSFKSFSLGSFVVSACWLLSVLGALARCGVKVEVSILSRVDLVLDLYRISDKTALKGRRVFNSRFRARLSNCARRT